MVEYGMETSAIAQQEKIQKPTILRKSDAYSFFETHRGTKINSAHYSEMLTERLNPGIRSKHRELLPKGVVSLHDNAHPSTYCYPQR
jgi:hypothetical protein